AFPQIQRPIFAHFDDVGRLYVGESSGENLNRAQMLEKKPHWITCLEDTNNDGVFDKSTRFVDDITLPQGMLWYRDSVYCACPPSIWKFTDTDGDGKADQREEILTGFGFNGNACDTHGPFLSPTGRLYIAQGRHGHEFKDKEGKTYSKGKAARIYSCRLDGSDVRVHCGGGFDNPVEIEFTEEGEVLGTVNILYPNRGDCLMHWVEGGVYPREDQQDCISEFKWTGGLLGPIVDMGHVALSGLMRYRGTHFGPEYKDQLFVTEFNTHKVKRIALKRSGSTFAAEPMEFLTCPDGDFHPTDVLEDADGSLLVVDTGAWFLNGCPTSRVAKPEMTGAIYRIRKTDGEKIDDPRGLRLRLADAGPAELIKHLDDRRPAVREAAVERLGRIFDRIDRLPPGEGLKQLTASDIQAIQSATVTQRAQLAVAIGRANMEKTLDPVRFRQLTVGDITSTPILWRVLTDQGFARRLPDEFIRPVAILLSNADHAALRSFLELASQPLIGQRSAPNVSADIFNSTICARLEGLGYDRLSEHAFIVFLQRSRSEKWCIQSIVEGSPFARRSALIALDQMDDSPLTAAMVTPLLATEDPTLQKTVLEVLARHPGWAKEALGTIRVWLGEKDLADDKANAIRTLLVSQAGDPEVQKLIAELLTGRETASGVETLLWEVLQRADVATWPALWSPLLQHALVNGDPQHQLVALRIIQRRELPDFDAAIAPLADNDRTPPLLRSEALTAIGPRLKDVD
ncbi:MAG TPA: PVC-type heme-binding CxxCH protein, partial [Planctomycetaceae bacterium]|nr:PVC-type heme-binding CxxCH protein [Planctomycetaceae bacterium]